MSASELAAFEAYCETLYNSPSAEERAKAEAALVQLSTTPEYIPRCQFVLSNSKVPSAQLVATNALKKLLQQSWNHLTPQQRVDYRNYVLNFLATSGPTSTHFVCAALVQLLACVTKLGWMDLEDHQQIMHEVSKFLQATPSHLALGLHILNQLVTEMNSSANTRSLAQHRKVAGSFRDVCLYQIFKVSLETLQRVQSRAIAAAEGEVNHIREQTLQLALSCLGYDFIGTTLDEASEELGTIQVPSTWRSAMEDPATMQLYFDVYAVTNPPSAKLALEVLVALGSLRRSLFSSDDERQAFLLRMMGGTLTILQTQRGLSDHDNYHELCRLLARLKANFQLSELVQSPNYAEWIAMVANFTVDSFKHWEWASNSVHYLLSLWSRLVASMPYLKGETPSHLESYVPQVITAFVNSRMELVSYLLHNADSDEVDDPLEDDEHLNEQLDTLPSLCRFQLQQVSTYVLSLFEPSARSYQQALSQPPAERTGNPAVQLQLSKSEGELAWLVYIIGQVLGSHLTPNSNAETQQLVDGELTATVLQLVPLLDNPEHARERCSVPSNQHLQGAIIFFLQQFRKVYVGDQATASSKVYARLQERLALSDHLAVLTVFVNKVVANLRLRSECTALNEKSLALFSDLAGGYCSGKLLLKLDTVHYMLRHHTSDDFPFMRVGQNVRLRTTFYSTLCKLLFLDDANIKFKVFMEPFTQLLRSLREQDDATFASPPVRAALVGVLRDLRGIVCACSNRRTYAFFFDWLYPAFTPLLQRTAVVYFDSPEVTTPLLKLYAELVWNKAQRLTFDSSSPNGILLFRDASAILVAYGSRIQERPVPPGADPYTCKYKGVSICMLLLTRALSGNYVNFGVFALYGDRALADCLEVTIQMCLHVNLEEILAYPKVARAYFTLMELLMRSHTATIVGLDTRVLRHLCSSLTEGLKSHEVAISSQCAAALEHLAAYRFREIVDEEDRGPSKLADESELFARQLATLLHMIVFEECTNQWSLSRPLLALILISEDAYAAWIEQALASMAQHPARQSKLALAFEKLLTDVPRGEHANLDVKTRDKFTQVRRRTCTPTPARTRTPAHQPSPPGWRLVLMPWWPPLPPPPLACALQNLSTFRHEVRTLV
jgi:exportin-7